MVFSFGKDHRRKADFITLKTDARRVGGGIAKYNKIIIIKKNKSNLFAF